MATPSEHLLRRPITLATQPRHTVTVMATQRAQPGRTPICLAIPTLPIPIITAGPPGPLPHQPTSLATQPRHIVIAMARHKEHPHLPPTILGTATLSNEATTRTRLSGRGSPISRKMLLPKSHLGDSGRTKPAPNLYNTAPVVIKQKIRPASSLICKPRQTASISSSDALIPILYRNHNVYSTSI